jgi:spermidine/putrescine transport system substrate-binding protein
MLLHPRQRPTPGMSRREFLRRSAALGIALPSAAAILAACSDPKESAGVPGGGQLQLARPDNPVRLPLYDDNPPIDDNLPVEKDATLKIYNWVDYIWKAPIEKFCKQYNCDYEYTVYNNQSEQLQKMSTGLVADVTFPTIDVLEKMARGKLLQPLNQSYITNIGDVWPVYKNPFYDQGWQYTVPYVTYTTGVAYRRAEAGGVVSDEEAAEKGYDLLWDSTYAGKVGIYDEYREAIGMSLLRNGVTDVNTGNETQIAQATNDLAELIDLVNVRLTINGVYAKLPDGVYDVHQSWAGDIIGAQWYLNDVKTPGETDVLGFWYPDDRTGMIGSDTIAIPANAENPVLAHKFLNFLIGESGSYQNFTWLGYQPPLNSLDENSLIKGEVGEYSPWFGPGTVPPTLPTAIVRESDFDTGYFLMELPPEADAIWQDHWDDLIAGAAGGN